MAPIRGTSTSERYSRKVLYNTPYKRKVAFALRERPVTLDEIAIPAEEVARILSACSPEKARSPPPVSPASSSLSKPEGNAFDLAMPPPQQDVGPVTPRIQKTTFFEHPRSDVSVSKSLQQFVFNTPSSNIMRYGEKNVGSPIPFRLRQPGRMFSKLPEGDNRGSPMKICTTPAPVRATPISPIQVARKPTPSALAEKITSISEENSPGLDFNTHVGQMHYAEDISPVPPLALRFDGTHMRQLLIAIKRMEALNTPAPVSRPVPVTPATSRRQSLAYAAVQDFLTPKHEPAQQFQTPKTATAGDFESSPAFNLTYRGAQERRLGSIQEAAGFNGPRANGRRFARDDTPNQGSTY